MNIQEKIKDKVIDLITLNSSGRLIISKIENADYDLKIEKRSDYKAKPIYIKIYYPGKEISAERKDAYVMHITFDFVQQDITDPILIISPLSKKFSLQKNDIGKYFIEELEK